MGDEVIPVTARTGTTADEQRGWPMMATPGCGFPCRFWNTTTGMDLGLAIAGLAWARTGRRHR